MTTRDARFTGERQELVQRLFPGGIPTLWCPSLTHYAEDGGIDKARIRAHLRSMHPWVQGFLMPGSTGEGWEMTDAEVRELLDFVIDEIRSLPSNLLIAILKTDVPTVLRGLTDSLTWLKRRTGTDDTIESLEKSSVRGFTICPPSGSELSQEQIRASLESVLAFGVPISLYQLPQVTENEMSPETVTTLSNNYPNFYLFKDTSGMDRVAASGFRGAFLVRGAEGDYATHLAAGGGNYDGFLLSTANCFGRQLSVMVENVQRGRKEEAEGFSRQLTALCDDVFGRAAKVPAGNAFANANKAMDHFCAHGPVAMNVAPPRLRSGDRLPKELLEAVGAAMKRYGLMPERGYLSHSAA
jgi:dihydrodipicolinate synthase/N-acetylneuraminate lyase